MRIKSVVLEQRNRIVDELRAKQAQIKDEIYDELQRSYSI